MLNHIVLMGRLTRDPELRYTQSQLPVASFTLAVDRDYGGRDGGEKQTDFIDIVAWRSTAEFVSKYFTKGSLVAVSGRLQLRDWTDREGNKRRSAEVVAENVYFGESKRRDSGESGGYRSGGDDYRGNAGGGNAGGGNDYRGSSGGGNDYRGSSGGGNDYRNSSGGGNDYRGNSGNSFRSFDETPEASAFSELSDTDGELPF